MRPLNLRPLALNDLREAVSWYEDRSPGLGGEFVAAVEVALAQIETAPASYRVVKRRVRKANVRRFPYTIFFIVTPDSVEVIAVLHGHRSPAALHGRL